MALMIFAQSSFSSKIYGQNNESITGEPESAIIILSTDTIGEMQIARKTLELNGVDIINVFPPRVFIGKGAKAVFEALKQADFIEQVSDELLDEATFESYESSVKGAVTFWNQRLKKTGYRITPSQKDKRRRAAPERKEEEPSNDELIIRDDLPKTEEERMKKEEEYRNTWKQLKEELRLREEEKKAKRRLRKKSSADQASSTTPLRQAAQILYSPDQEQANLFGKASSGGAGYYDTSLYMTGEIAVGVFFTAENDGNWTNEEIDKTFADICNALNQFRDDEPNANIGFTFIKEVDEDSGVPKFPPAYGFEHDFARYKLEGDYVNNLRNIYNTHWAFIIIVYKGDGRAHASYFGPTVSLYSNDLRDGQTVRHETMHIFGAMDQYNIADRSPIDRWGYLNVVNANSQYNDGKGYFSGAGEAKADLMSDLFRSNHSIGVYSRGQIGWRDSDGDGILEPLDSFPDTVILSKTGANPVTYIGKAQDKPLLCEYRGYGSVTLNIIKSVEYRINNGAWCEAVPVDGAYDSAIEEFNFTTPSLSNGDYTIEIRAINSVNNAETSYAKDKLQIKASSLTNVRPFVSFSITPPKGSIDTNFSLDANSSSDIEDGVSSLYTRWDFENDGIFDTAFSQNKLTTHKYDSHGIKTVKLEVRDRLGLTNTVTKQAEVAATNLAPEAFFAVTPENNHSASEELIANLNAQDSYDGEDALNDLKFRWDFEGDGVWDTPYLDTPIMEHTYTLPVNLVSISPISNYKLKSDGCGIFVLGNYLYVASDDLEIIDISNPLAPASVGICVTSGYAVSVYVRDRYAYVGHDNSLQVIDISEPSHPVIKASIKFSDADSTRIISILGNYMYLASGFSGLQIIDISDPLNPVLKTKFDADGYAYGYVSSVFVESNYAYVTVQLFGLLIIDITNPQAPILKGTCRTEGVAIGVSILGNYAYIAIDQACLEIIDISNPSNPIWKTNFHVNGIAKNVFIFDNYVYVTTYNSGLSVFDISDPLKPGLKVFADTLTGLLSSVYVARNYVCVSGFDKESLSPVVSIFDLNQTSSNSATKYFDHASKRWRCRLEVKDKNDQISQAVRDVWKVTYNHPPILESMDINSAEVFDIGIVSSATVSAFDPDKNTSWDGLLEYRWDFEDDGVWDTKYSELGNEVIIPFGSPAIVCEVRDRFNAATKKTVTFDITPPTGSIKINNGNQYTVSTEVTIDLTASDEESGIDKIQLSNDGVNYFVPEAYAATKPWTLAGVGGKRTVYVKFSDKSGNWSEVYSDGIILDTTEPPIPRIYKASLVYNRITRKFDLSALLYFQRDPESGPLRYKYSVTEDSPNGLALKDWSFTVRFMARSIRVLNLDLANGKTYYLNVKAISNAGLESNVLSIKTVAQQPQISPPVSPYRRPRW